MEITPPIMRIATNITLVIIRVLSQWQLKKSRTMRRKRKTKKIQLLSNRTVRLKALVYNKFIGYDDIQVVKRLSRDFCTKFST